MRRCDCDAAGVPLFYCARCGTAGAVRKVEPAAITPRMPLVGRRVVVIATGERGNCTDYSGGLYWCVMADGEPYGYEPHQLRELGMARRFARWALAWVWS